MNKKFFPAALLCCAALFVPIPAQAADQELPILSVSGSGVVQGTPDQATVTLGVVTRRKTAGDAQQENAAKAAAIHRALIAFGIDGDDIMTEDYSFRPEYNHDKSGRTSIVGYTASNTVRVKVRDVDLVGGVIDAALDKGANMVRSLDFSIRDMDALRREALEQAVEDAREKAETIARALGTTIVGVHHVTENTGMFQPRRSNMVMMAKSMDAAAESTPIEAGTLSLSADVHIEFILAR
ncbi:MAG: SIMPL domain-containing protein [Schwartzia sp.]|nr:SIMPL domain-containing protein [Schwartzia sp. (in: firmicutes)]